MPIILKVEDKVLLTISNEGKVEYDPSYSPDDAARFFWNAVGRKYVEYDLVYRHMEAVLSRLGSAEIALESLKHEIDDTVDPSKLSALETVFDTQSEQLENLMSTAIELGRGLAKRGLPIKDPPTRLPQCVIDDEDNEYAQQDLIANKRVLN